MENTSSVQALPRFGKLPAFPFSIRSQRLCALLLAGFAACAGVSWAQDEVTYVRVTAHSARVYAEPTEESAKLGVAESGQRFRMVDYTQDWFKVVYLNGTPPVEGWVERTKAAIEQKSEPELGNALREHSLLIAIAGGSVVALLLIVWLVVVLSRRAERKAGSQLTSGMQLIIVAQQTKEIRFSLTNTTSTIDRCFAKVGYTTHRIASIQAFQQRIKHRLPDVVLVDWQFTPPIADDIEIELNAEVNSRVVPLIYYNVPPEIPASRRTRVRNVYYLGTEISDRDLFKIIQPHTHGVQQSTIQRKGADGSAIEGDITEGSLGGVMQLLEIGQKSGCLLVRQEEPAGMIFFEGGNPVCAATRTNKGEKAVYELLDLTTGKFRFATDQKAPERNCSISTMGALMEWARIKDEKSRS